MAVPTSSSRYHLLRGSDDELSRDASPPEHPSDRNSQADSSFSIDLNPALVLRIASLGLGLAAFIVAIKPGRFQRSLIGADIFFMCSILVNFYLIIHHFVSHFFVVAVEFRHHKHLNPSITFEHKTSYVDGFLSCCLLFCLLITSITKGVSAAVVMGYIIVLLHFLVALPQLDSTFLMFKMTKHEKCRPDPPVNAKVALQTAVVEEPRTAEDLV
ncbi:hypothetical protein B7494_g4811 [Chlorociboria aeruginascens]|nr:hypothetical protein B7494_g4811 [Chlorociboria aeruginascens]